jgi:hypothetical protein
MVGAAGGRTLCQAGTKTTEVKDLQASIQSYRIHTDSYRQETPRSRSPFVHVPSSIVPQVRARSSRAAAAFRLHPHTCAGTTRFFPFLLLLHQLSVASGIRVALLPPPVSVRRLCHTDAAERLLRRVLLIARRTQEQRRVTQRLQVAAQRAEWRTGRAEQGDITGAGRTGLLVLDVFPLSFSCSLVGL